MDTMSTDRDRTEDRTSCADTWVNQMYAACEALSVSVDGMISALSVTVPRDEGFDNLPQIELLTTGLAELFHLEVTVKPRTRNVTVRFALPAPGGNHAGISPKY